MIIKLLYIQSLLSEISPPLITDTVIYGIGIAIIGYLIKEIRELKKINKEVIENHRQDMKTQSLEKNIWIEQSNKMYQDVFNTITNLKK